MIVRRSASEIARMRQAGALVARAHDAVQAAAAPGVTTAALDQVVRRVIAGGRGTPSFLGYGAGFGRTGFPAAACISTGDVVAHGIPSEHVVLSAGDVVRVDIGAEVDGYHGDAARTFVVGGGVGVGVGVGRVAALIAGTEEALAAGIEAFRVGGHLDDIGAAIQAVARRGGLGIVEDYVGHGIGRALHEDPAVPNTGRRGHGPCLEVGWVLAIEPMFTLGSGATGLDDDGWTIRIADGSPSAHAEHTVALTPDGPEILTA